MKRTDPKLRCPTSKRRKVWHVKAIVFREERRRQWRREEDAAQQKRNPSARGKDRLPRSRGELLEMIEDHAIPGDGDHVRLDYEWCER